VARQGSGETRSRTERAAEDRGGSGAIRPTRAAAVRLGADRSRERRGTRRLPPSPRPAAHAPRPTLLGDLADPTPVELGPSARASLEAGLAALGLELDTGDRAAIERHAGLVLAWTRLVDLTATVDPEAFVRDHVVDSLTAVPVLRRRRVERFLDLGSGGGLPGIPLAVALPAEACLVEARAKRAAVLERMVTALGLAGRIRVVAARAEDLAADPTERARWTAVTARAVGPLAELVELALPLLAPGGVLVAWKAGRLGEELPAAERAAAALGGGRPEVVTPAGAHLRDLLGGRRLVLVEKLRPTPGGYPRRPTVRRRRPW
jgi:16S rRNA (guanine527-N7)-methyltransferase